MDKTSTLPEGQSNFRPAQSLDQKEQESVIHKGGYLGTTADGNKSLGFYKVMEAVERLLLVYI